METNLDQTQTQRGSDWGRFIRKHWGAFAALIAAAVLAVAGAVYVFVWFTANAQTTGLVPSTLNLWTMSNLVWFIIYAALWELAVIGVPAVIGAAAGWQWWKRLPETEKSQYHLSGKPKRSSRAGGAVSPLLFIAFALKVYVDGNWNAAISGWTLNYVVGSMVTILLWIIAIFAVPAVIALVWWINREMNRKP